MDSPFSDAITAISEIRDAARRGDWNTASELARTLAQQAPPENPEILAAYLHHLKDALRVARASRAQAAASLVRLNAAARFLYPAPPSECQIIGEAADPCQTARAPSNHFNDLALESPLH